MKFRSLLIALLAISPGSVFALDMNPGEALVLWTGGSGEAVAATLRAIRGFMGEGGFDTLFTFIALSGFLAFVMSVALGKDKLEKFPGYLMGLFLATYIGLYLTVNVQVEDPVKGHAEVVEDIPAVVALPAVVAGEVGNWLTEAIEFFYQSPTSFPSGQPMGAFGTMGQTNRFNLMGQLMKDMTEVKITDPGMKASFRAYVADCVAPRLYNGAINYRNMMQSNDAWAVMEVTSETTYTTYYGPQAITDPRGDVKTCNDAYEELSEDLDLFYDTAKEGIARKESFLGNFESLSWVEGALNASLTWSTQGAQNDASSAVRQAAVLNTFADTSSSIMNSVAGGEGIAYNMALAEAKSAQSSQWKVAADIFSTFMGYFYVVLHVFVIAISPMVVLLMLLPGSGSKIGGMFFKVLIWLALWQPSLSIVNFISNSFLVSGLGEPILIPDAGVTMANITAISVATEKMVLASNFMGTMVPMFMWGIINATGYAMTQFVGAGTGSQQAAGAGKQIATDSINHGNHSLDNTRANQFDMAYSHSIGAKPPEANMGGALQTAGNINAGGLSATVGGANGYKAMNTHTKKTDYSDTSSASDTTKGAESFNDNTRFGNQKSITTQDALASSLGKSYQEGSNGTKLIQGSTMQQGAQQVGENLSTAYKQSADTTSMENRQLALSQDLAKSLKHLLNAGSSNGEDPGTTLNKTAAFSQEALKQVPGLSKEERQQIASDALTTAITENSLEAAEKGGADIGSADYFKRAEQASEKYQSAPEGRKAGSLMDKARGAAAKVGKKAVIPLAVADGILAGAGVTYSKIYSAKDGASSGIDVNAGNTNANTATTQSTGSETDSHTTTSGNSATATSTQSHTKNHSDTDVFDISKTRAITGERAHLLNSQAARQVSSSTTITDQTPNLDRVLRGVMVTGDEQRQPYEDKKKKVEEEIKATGGGAERAVNAAIEEGKGTGVAVDGSVSEAKRKVDEGMSATGVTPGGDTPFKHVGLEGEQQTAAQARIQQQDINMSNMLADNNVAQLKTQVDLKEATAESAGGQSGKYNAKLEGAGAEQEKAGAFSSVKDFFADGPAALFNGAASVFTPEQTGDTRADVGAGIARTFNVAENLAVAGSGERSQLVDLAVTGSGDSASLQPVYSVPFQYQNDAGVMVEGQALGFYAGNGQYFPIAGIAGNENFSQAQLSGMAGTPFVAGAGMNGNTPTINGQEWQGDLNRDGQPVFNGAIAPSDVGLNDDMSTSVFDNNPTGQAVQDAGNSLPTSPAIANATPPTPDGSGYGEQLDRQGFDQDQREQALIRAGSGQGTNNLGAGPRPQGETPVLDDAIRGDAGTHPLYYGNEGEEQNGYPGPVPVHGQQASSQQPSQLQGQPGGDELPPEEFLASIGVDPNADLASMPDRSRRDESVV